MASVARTSEGSEARTWRRPTSPPRRISRRLTFHRPLTLHRRPHRRSISQPPRVSMLRISAGRWGGARIRMERARKLDRAAALGAWTCWIWPALGAWTFLVRSAVGLSPLLARRLVAWLLLAARVLRLGVPVVPARAARRLCHVLVERYSVLLRGQRVLRLGLGREWIRGDESAAGG